jgi:hypothetical protein
MPRAFVALLALPLLVAAGCGNKNVDTTTVEKGIEQQVVVGGTPVTNVDCPSDVESQVGATFRCGVAFANGASAKVEVEQEQRGHYGYALVPGSLHVPGKAFEDDIRQSLSQKGITNAAINCPDDVIVKVGTYVVCEVAGANGQQGTVKFTFSDASGTVDSSSVSTTS